MNWFEMLGSFLAGGVATYVASKVIKGKPPAPKSSWEDIEKKYPPKDPYREPAPSNPPKLPPPPPVDRHD